MNARDAWVEQMKANLDTWNAELDALEAKAAAAGGETRAAFHEQMKSLMRQRDEVSAKIEKVRSAGEDAWLDIKTGTEDAWNALGGALRSAAEKFQS